MMTTTNTRPTFCLTEDAAAELNEAGVVGYVDHLTIYERVDVRGTGWLIAPLAYLEAEGRCVADMGRAIMVFADDCRPVG